MKKLIKAFGYAFHGLADVFQTSINFRIGLVITVLVLIISCLLKIGFLSWIVVIFTCVVVLAAEAVNTAVEKFLDFFHPEKHPQIKHVKDIMAASVVICVIGAFFVGLIVFGVAIANLLKG